ncbi:MAG: ferritin [Bacteroidales bacterium]|nr:ferritin [Bacteroidales bacterium]
MNKKVEKALNEQINAELYSSYLYLSMSAWASVKGFKGTQHWLRLQAQEELTHAMKMYDFILGRGGSVNLKQIEAAENKWEGVLELFESVYKHEQKVTELINDLYDLCLKEKDHATGSFLQWFINEQVEEEANVTTIIDQLKLAGAEGPGLYMIDKELSVRVLTPATTA